MTSEPRKCPRVLVVDDDPVIRARLEEHWSRFREANPEVGELEFVQTLGTAAGIQALHEGGFDLILLDYRFPDEPEPDPHMRFLSCWRGDGATVPILMLTAEQDRNHRDKLQDDLEFVEAADTRPRYKDWLRPEFGWTLARTIWKQVGEPPSRARHLESPSTASTVAIDFRPGRRLVIHPDLHAGPRRDALERAAVELNSGEVREVARALLRLGTLTPELFAKWRHTPAGRRDYASARADACTRLREVLGEGCLPRVRGAMVSFDPALVSGRPFWCNVTEAHRHHLSAMELCRQHWDEPGSRHLAEALRQEDLARALDVEHLNAWLVAIALEAHHQGCLQATNARLGELLKHELLAARCLAKAKPLVTGAYSFAALEHSLLPEGTAPAGYRQSGLLGKHPGTYLASAGRSVRSRRVRPEHVSASAQAPAATSTEAEEELDSLCKKLKTVPEAELASRLHALERSGGKDLTRLLQAARRDRQALLVLARSLLDGGLVPEPFDLESELRELQARGEKVDLLSELEALLAKARKW